MENLVYKIHREIAIVENEYGKRPNRIILGTQVYEELVAYHYQLIIHTDDTKPKYFMGIPITIDDEDVNRCSVCIEFEISI